MDGCNIIIVIQYSCVLFQSHTWVNILTLPIVYACVSLVDINVLETKRVLTTYLLNYDRSNTIDCSGVGKFSIWWEEGGVQTLVPTGIWGGGAQCISKVMVGGWPLLLTPAPFSYAYGLYIFTGKVGDFICFIGNRNFTTWEASYLLTRRWRIVSCWTVSF